MIDEQLQHDRRQRLSAWLVGKKTPPREKSFFHQLLSGKAPFGEKAARRIEREYGMFPGYLDGLEPNLNREQIIGQIVAALPEMSTFKLKALATLIAVNPGE
jgi:hypothetical protein